MMRAGYVRKDWPRILEAGGRELLRAWYDRPYEYAWAGGILDRVGFLLGRPPRVLDIGPGGYQPWIDELALRGCDLAAVDLDPVAVASVTGRLGRRVVAWVGDGKTTDVRVDYDLVTCVSVIEHDPDWRRFVANLARARRLLLTFGVVRRGGKDDGQVLIREMDVPEVLALLAAGGSQPLEEIEMLVPEDAVALEPLGWLTFVGYFENREAMHS